ncbi:MAG: hypothetical protein SOZ90_06255, partial [Candidatus Faecousia sp.]|nr:hypothetical protein [Candidatus Faecousia sp.]
MIFLTSLFSGDAPHGLVNRVGRFYALFRKKCLTNGVSYGNICKLSDERLPNSPEERKTHRKSLKKVKKALDKFL